MKLQSYGLIAGQTQSVAQRGNNFRLLTSGLVNVSFEMLSGESFSTDLIGGLGITLPNEFVRIVLLSQSNQTVQFIAGVGSSDDSRGNSTVTIASAANVADSTDVACPNGARTLVSPQNLARSSVLITNLDTTNTVRVGGASVAANKGTPLQAGMTLTLDVSGAIHVWNASGASVTVTVSELTA